MERAMITLLTITKIRILKVVLLNIFPFRLRLIPLLAGASPLFPVTFLSLLFLKNFFKPKKSRSFFVSGGLMPRGPMDDRL